MNEEVILKNPTIGDVVKLLSTMDQTKDFLIIDCLGKSYNNIGYYISEVAVTAFASDLLDMSETDQNFMMNLVKQFREHRFASPYALMVEKVRSILKEHSFDCEIKSDEEKQALSIWKTLPDGQKFGKYIYAPHGDLDKQVDEFICAMKKREGYGFNSDPSAI